MIKANSFKKEYITGRKDQYDLDYAIFRKCVEESNTMETLIELFEEKMKYVISKIGYERANDLMEELELI